MRVALVVLMLWASCAVADDKPFRLIGTSGKPYSAVAKGLTTWIEDGEMHGFAQVHVQDAPGKPVVWAFHFNGCESGRGTAFWNTRATALMSQ